MAILAAGAGAVTAYAVAASLNVSAAIRASACQAESEVVVVTLKPVCAASSINAASVATAAATTIECPSEAILRLATASWAVREP